MLEANTYSLRLRTVLFVCINLIWMVPTRADFYTYEILSVEWLVDFSEAIVVVEGQLHDGHTEKDASHWKVIEVLKGDPSTVTEILAAAHSKPCKYGGNTFAPPTVGAYQLLFLRENRLMQAVGLGREVSQEKDLHTHNIWYGASQFGELFISPESLMNCVRKRIESGPGVRLSKWRGKWMEKQASLPFVQSTALHGCALETTEAAFDLRVPPTTEWRDHYIRVLKSGDAAQRLSAINQLGQVNDDETLRAFRLATTAKDMPIGYRRTWHGPSQAMVTADNVRSQAEKAISSLESLRR